MRSVHVSWRVKALLAAVLLLVTPELAWGQQNAAPEPPHPLRVVFRTNADADVPAGAQEDLVVVIGGSARVAGRAGLVAVVNGRAELAGARVDQLVVVNGVARLTGATRVSGDVDLVDAALSQDQTASIGGTIARSTIAELGGAMRRFTLTMLVGCWIALLLAGQIAAAVAAKGVRRVGHVMTNRVGATALSAAVMWIGMPFAAVMVLATGFGVPMGVGYFVLILPALAALGWLVAGIRLGELVLEAMHRPEHRDAPLAAALVGIGLLLVASLTPLLSALVGPLAALGGSGALGVVLWERASAAVRPHRAAPPTPPAEGRRIVHAIVEATPADREPEHALTGVPSGFPDTASADVWAALRP